MNDDEKEDDDDKNIEDTSTKEKSESKPKLLEQKRNDSLDKQVTDKHVHDKTSVKKEKSENDDEGEYIQTLGASERPNESFFASNLENLTTNNSTTRDEVEKDLAKFKEHIEQSLNDGAVDMMEQDALKLWLEYESITCQLSKELCEQLRLILEPTVCSKLKGLNKLK